MTAEQLREILQVSPKDLDVVFWVESFIDDEDLDDGPFTVKRIDVSDKCVRIKLTENVPVCFLTDYD